LKFSFLPNIICKINGYLIYKKKVVGNSLKEFLNLAKWVNVQTSCAPLWVRANCFYKTPKNNVLALVLLAATFLKAGIV
jgi:hypothetical protein